MQRRRRRAVDARTFAVAAAVVVVAGVQRLITSPTRRSRYLRASRFSSLLVEDDPSSAANCSILSTTQSGSVPSAAGVPGARGGNPKQARASVPARISMSTKCQEYE
jgi:hypothetical protein